MRESGVALTQSEKKILIVEDHPIVREGVVALVKAEEGMTVCGQTSDPYQVLKLAKSTKPDLVLLDLMLDGQDGLDIIKALHAHMPETKILVFTMHEESIYAERSLRAGASGYLMKQEDSDKVITGIKNVLKGEIYVSHNVAGNFMRRSLKSNSKDGKRGLDALSDRELHVFQLIGSGKTTRHIAEQLGISVKTVESHRENIKNKMSLDNSTSLVRSATLWMQGQHR